MSGMSTSTSNVGCDMEMRNETREEENERPGDTQRVSIHNTQERERETKIQNRKKNIPSSINYKISEGRRCIFVILNMLRENFLIFRLNFLKLFKHFQPQ